MKERPILMHARSINGILEGRKTQTRRIVKPQPPSVEEIVKKSGSGYSLYTDGHYFGTWRVAGPVWAVREAVERDSWLCPYGQPGDRLWVRESFSVEWNGGIRSGPFKEAPVTYRAEGMMFDADYRWKPSIHMPRTACRIVLEVTNIRVERVQDISDADCKAEGCQIPEVMHADEPIETYDYRTYFRALWDDTNGAGAWERNDWVWIVDFKRIEQ